MKALFVGVGSIGTRHIFDFYEVCLSNGVKPEIYVLRREAGQLSPKIKDLVIQQLTELPKEDHYDVIFITNPTSLHYLSLKQLCKRGDYFFIEKPIFDNYTYDDSVLGIHDLNAYVAAPMRHTKIYKELKKIVDKREVFSSRIICSSYLPSWRPNIDYRMNYSARKEMGGGVCLDLIHEIDYMVGLFGLPKDCKCIHGKYSNLEITSDDLSVYIAVYPEMICEVHLDYFGRKYRRSCEVFTDEGTYIADFSAETIETPTGEVIDCTDIADSEFKNEMDYFYRFISGSGEVFNSPQLALNVLKISLGG